jgi:hypothetical protein
MGNRFSPQFSNKFKNNNIIKYLIKIAYLFGDPMGHGMPFAEKKIKG